MRKEDEYQTIEQDWPRFYREYPEIYDRFSGHSETTASIISTMFRLDDKVVLEAGSGTGIATLELAKRAKFVIAVELKRAMIKVAVKKAQGKGVTNIAFVYGDGSCLPLAANSVDSAITLYAGPLPHEQASRVVRQGGFIIRAGNHHRWYGGELAPVILGKSRKDPEDLGGKLDKHLRKELNYSYKDIFVTHTYSSVKEAVETYGFIFGKKAIDYLVAHNKTSIKHKLRIYYKKVES